MTRENRAAAGPSSGKPGRPLRLGAIDVGSNALRMSVAEVGGVGALRVMDEQRAQVRLGAAVARDGHLAAEAMDAAMRALAGFRARLDAFGARRVRAVATSAVRESHNAAEFVARCRAEAGVDLEVIAGAEEARLVYVAVRDRMPLGSRAWVLVDVGGGSVEVSLVDARRVLASESHPFGAVRLLEEIARAGAAAPEALGALVREHAARLRVPELARQAGAAGMIGVGGNIEALAKLAGAPHEVRRPARLAVAEVRRLVELLRQMPSRARIEQLGLRPDRADVIVPAALIYERIAALCGVDEIHLPRVGLRDGILLELAAELGAHP